MASTGEHKIEEDSAVYEDFEQELETILSLDPLERINLYTHLEKRLRSELEETPLRKTEFDS